VLGSLRERGTTIPVTGKGGRVHEASRVDLKISEIVDVPNFVVSAVLPLDIFV
jgi:acetamidase/formamidase